VIEKHQVALILGSPNLGIVEMQLPLLSSQWRHPICLRRPKPQTAMDHPSLSAHLSLELLFYLQERSDPFLAGR
jgi:hypothetical protein